MIKFFVSFKIIDIHVEVQIIKELTHFNLIAYYNIFSVKNVIQYGRYIIIYKLILISFNSRKSVCIGEEFQKL